MTNQPLNHNKAPFDPFAGPEIERVIPTTRSQSELLIDCDLGGNDAKKAYNIPYSLKLFGFLDFGALKKAVQAIIKRHESLRAVFSEDAKFMSIFTDIEINILYQDLTNLDEQEKESTKNTLIKSDSNYVFNLIDGPLFKISLIKTAEFEHELVLTFHHTICDGLSVDSFLKELGIIYSAFVKGDIPDLPRPKKFSVFAEQENLFLETEAYKKAEDFWTNMYKESIPKVELPIDHTRPDIRTYNNDTLYYKLNNKLFKKLKQTGLSTGSSIVTTFLSAFDLFLYQQTGQNDIVVGLSTSRHAHYNKMGMIGHCVNALPLRSKIDTNATFKDYLKTRKTQLFDAYEHQSISFGHLLQKLPIPRDLSRIPLMPVMMNIEFNSDLESTFSFEGLSHELINNHRDYATFEIEVQAHMSKDGPYVRLNYNSSLFRSETINEMMVSFESLIEQFIENPNSSILDIVRDSKQSNNTGFSEASEETTTLTDIEALTIGKNFDQEFENFYEEKTLVDLFTIQAKKTPNNTAVAFNDKTITYKELDTLSTKLSNYITNHHDVEVNDLVAVMLERSEWVVITAIAILKSGAAYVPIEPDYPEKRKNYIINDSQCRITINPDFINKFLEEIDSFSSVRNNSIKILPENLCYVIYTSGTTGNPKGVMIEHRNVISLLFHGKYLYKFDENDVWCMFHSFCFDVSVWEMYGSLLFGGKLIVVSKTTVKDPFEFLSFISKEGITILNQTPSAFINLIDSTENVNKVDLNIRYVIFAGEALYPKHLARWHKQYPDIKFINMYGITEITVHATFKEIKNREIESNQSNIGTCIPTLAAYILDEHQNPQPIGVVGELYVSGKGVARGYLNRPELTKERFLPDIFNKGEIMYRSGDLVKRLPNGEMEFIGRIDDQVKIRGYRIEMREVEAALNSLPSIKRSVVITSNHLTGELSLVAYLQPIETANDSNIIRNQLAQILPEFQIPSTFMWIDSFPLTTNGKIDKKNLPNPEYLRPESGAALKLPQTKLEKDVSKIWSEFLKIPLIGIDDIFFEIGGSSLLAQRVIAALRQKFNIEIPLIKIFQFPTIATLSDFISENVKTEESIVPNVREDNNFTQEIFATGNTATHKDLNNTATSYPDETLHELIWQQAEKTPKNVALEFKDKRVTYKNLQEQINLTAHYLNEQGVKPGDVIGVSLPRSLELVSVLLAIMQCGACYLPLDPKYPNARLDFMLEDAEATFLITTEALSYSFSKKHSLIFLENLIESLKNYPTDRLTIDIKNNATAYIIYTSGSTGKPKGVTITHKNLVNFLFSMSLSPGIKEADRLLSITTISFDIAGLELFLPLANGATLILADDETASDSWLLLDLIKNKDISILQATPTTWQMLLDSEWNQALPIKALCGGEAMPINLAQQLLERCMELWNVYGPTETTIWSTIKQIKQNETTITIGKPIANTQIYLLNDNNDLVKPGSVGEIGIAGDGVAQGYLKRPKLNSEKFIPNPFSKNPDAKLYKTGDLGKLLPNGEILCLGRADQQVKIRGHRIELGEIETVLDGFSNIKQSVVIVKNIGDDPKIIAYLKPSSKDQQDSNAVRKQLEGLLPDILIPSIYMWIENFPVTPNGKIDKKNLPNPINSRPETSSIIKQPKTKLEKLIADVWIKFLNIPVISLDDNFFEIGGSSIIAQKTIALLRKKLNTEIPLIKIFQHPTILKLSDYLNEHINSEDAFTLKNQEPSQTSSKDIAIIAMSGRFPGAESLDDLWKILKEGEESISFYTKDELDASIPDHLRNDPLYITARGVLPSAKTFDNLFFGLNPLLAKTMDPQQRIFLEICWEALEQSGHLPKHYNGRIGVYAGCDNNSYHINNLLHNKDLTDQVGNYQVYISNSKDFIAPRIAYHLNLKGPAVSVHSACSTSLLAITQAVEAIRNGQCEVALAGGASITSPIYKGHLYEEGSIYSPDGHCRSFDASGKGTVFSDGAGVFLLKSLNDAKRDGDNIYGVIKGIGVNNDGGDKGSFTAPSAKGQAGAITNALNDAQVLPSSISYLEAHGTATPIGDPIEVEGLKIAYGKQINKGYCGLGSIKSNIGHTGAAAGAAGLMKTLLALKHKQIPPVVGFKKPNPNIDFNNSPFYVADTLKDWNVDGARRAGISSFGVGGTNVHIIVEEYEQETAVPELGRPSQILTWSAKNENSASGFQSSLGLFLEKSPKASLADVAYSLNVTREDFSHRRFSIADTTLEASKNLITSKTNTVKSSTLKVIPNEIGFLFPGQGSQYLQMGKTLYLNEKVYRDALDTCADLLMADLNLDIRNILFPKTNSEEAQALIKNTQYTQPVLFAQEYALSQLWISWGIKPTLLCGHSIGEFVAAHLAGVLNLKDALHLIATRGKLVSQLPGGRMLSVRMPEDNLKVILPKTLSLAAVNSNKLCVVAGKEEDIELFSKTLKDKKILNKVLLTSHAFHSFMMDPILKNFEDALKKVTFNPPSIPIISTVTGTWLTDNEATSVYYWVNHLKNTVRFADSIDTVLKLNHFVLLEVGPGKALTTLAQQQAGKIISAFPSLEFSKEEKNTEYTTILNALGNMWLQGVDPDWPKFYSEQKRQKLNLPSYVFDRKPCWVDPITTNTAYQKPATKPLEDIEDIAISESSSSVSKKDNTLLKISNIISLISGITYESDISDSTFLELGLDSLTLTQLSSKLRKEFSLHITFRQLSETFVTPNLLAEYFNKSITEENSEKEISESISNTKTKISESLANDQVPELIIPATRAQSEILTDCFFGGDDAKKAYNQSLSLNFNGKLDTDALNLSIQSLIKRHESLRASFSKDSRFMHIYSDSKTNISFTDLSSKSINDIEASKKTLIREEANYLFDLVNGPLFKLHLIRTNDTEHTLTLTLNHAICDGLSTRVLIEDLSTLYSAYAQNIEPELPESPKFSVFADKENDFTDSDAYNKSETFWLNMYQDSIPKLELPIDYPRPALRTYNCERLDFLINEKTLNTLRDTGKKTNTTIVTSLVAAFEIFLYQQTSQNDIVLGLTSSRYAHYDMMQMIGHAVNLLPLRSTLDSKISFNDYLLKRKTELFDAYEHQSLSFGHLLKKLAIPRDPSRIPLVPAIINIQLNSNLSNDCSFHNLSHELTSNPRSYGTFELELQAVMTQNGPCFRWNYNTNLFKPETIESMMVSFETLIEKLVSNPTSPITDIVTSDFLPVYNALNQTKVHVPSEPLHILLKNQAKLTPTKTAVEFNDTKVSYQNLHKNINQLAQYFASQGIKHGDFIGVALDRGPELIATLIAILQCGAAYVPLDPNYPKSRLEFILSDSKAKYLVINKHHIFDFDQSIKKLNIEDALSKLVNLPNSAIESHAKSTDIAYILYTSGTTGKPKGVPVTHANLVNLLSSLSNKPGITKKDRFLAITTISFDIVGVEIYLPLLNGATVIIADAETTRNGELLLELVKTKDISILQATPTTWKMLLQSKWNSPLNIKAFCGGEALTYDLAQQILSKCDVLWNMYGPTETTIYSIIKQIQPTDELITIGKPIDNTEVYLINELGDLVKPGAIGEITISGRGVAQGYWKRPELTSEKFIPQTFNSSSGPKLYRTGDLGKLLPNNDIICLGRIDQQIKINGYRIEPEEIESTLLKSNNIKEAVVLAQNEKLIAFVTLVKFEKITSKHIDKWKDNLASDLPSYFVPSKIKVLETLPTTPNGKLDKQALLQSESIEIETSFVTEPKTNTEKLIASIWLKYLHLDYLDIKNNFFELGGNSLIAIQVMNKLEEETGKILPLSSLFEHSSIEKLALLLDQINNTETWSSLVPIKPTGSKRPVYIVHGAGMEVLIFKELADNLDADQPVFGLQAKALFNTTSQYHSIGQIADHYVKTIIENNPKGPYALAGYSFGGVIAYEMARTLIALGKEVDMVGLFDTIIESHFYHASSFRKKTALMAYRNKRRLRFFMEMTQSWDNIKFHVNRKKEFLLNQYWRTKNFANDQEQVKYEEFLKTESIIQPIKNRYHMVPLNIRVDLFRAEEHTSYIKSTAFSGWKHFALKGVNIHKTPGNHDTMLTSAHVKEVARIFQNALDKNNKLKD